MRKNFARCYDLIFSMLLIISILSWLTPLLAIISKLTNSGPVFLKRIIAGKNGKIICVLSYFDPLHSYQISNTNVYSLMKNSHRLYNVFLGDMSASDFIKTYNQSVIVLGYQSKIINSVDYLSSLKYVLPREIRLELSDLYFQMIDDLKFMKEDMLDKNLPLWWINIILVLNTFSVVICLLYDYLKRILGCILILK